MMFYTYKDFVKEIIPFVKQCFEEVIIFTSYISQQSKSCIVQRSKVVVRPYRGVHNKMWVVSIKFKVKEMYVPDSYTQLSKEQRKERRIHNFQPIPTNYDGCKYMEKRTLFGNYRWVYEIYYCINPHPICIKQGDMEDVVFAEELDRFKDRIRMD